jgi:putative glycosyltransferase (TIGR04348 family)
MKVLFVTPAPPGSRKGNRISALRWAGMVQALGHRAVLAEEYRVQRCDVLVALHARKSAAAIARFRAERPEAPLVLALTGTDLYDDVHTSAEAQQSLELADRLLVLQPLAVEELPERLRPKARVIYQSVPPPNFQVRPRAGVFEVCVMGHLRPVKDPFRTAESARLLPADSRLRVLHLGGALSADMERQARAEAETNGRYRWLGELPRPRALRVLGRCRLLVLTSLLEGGANVIGEAVVLGVPVLSSRIAGSVGLLGEDYPGYFPVGDTRALAELLRRAETDAGFLAELQARCEERRGLFDPARERASWRELLAELNSSESKPDAPARE